MIWASFSLWIAIATRRGGKKLSHNFIKLKWRDHNNTRPARRLLKINLICQRKEEWWQSCARDFFPRTLLKFIWNMPTVDSLGWESSAAEWWCIPKGVSFTISAICRKCLNWKFQRNDLFLESVDIFSPVILTVQYLHWTLRNLFIESWQIAWKSPTHRAIAPF